MIRTYNYAGAPVNPITPAPATPGPLPVEQVQPPASTGFDLSSALPIIIIVVVAYFLFK